MKYILSTEALNNERTGIGNYTSMLTRHAKKYFEKEDLFFFNNGNITNKPISNYSSNILIKKLKRRLNKFFNQSVDLNRIQPVKFHGTNYFLPDFIESGFITVHDLSVIRLPETHPDDRVKFFNKNIHQSIEKAQKIFTDSNFTKNELIDIYSISPNIIQTITLGADMYDISITKQKAISEIIPYNIKYKSFILCIATIEPRKNIINLIRAYKKLPEKIKTKYPLILVGSRGWKCEKIFELIHSSDSTIMYFGYLNNTQIASFYKSASFFVYPSIYEGFGLPVAEASYFKLPLLISDIPVFRELFPNANFFNPYDIDHLFQKIKDTIESFEDRELTNKTINQKNYDMTWQETAIKTFASY